MGKCEEYDWLDDPFDEKKAAAERERARMGGGSKAAIGCGCALVVFVVLAFFGVLLGTYGWLFLKT